MGLRQRPLIRPMVRYVDQDQAVIEIHITIAAGWTPPPVSPIRDLQVLVAIEGSDGFIDEQRLPLRLHNHRGMVRYEMVQPQRWWPAGMGEQGLYQLSITLIDNQRVIGAHTSVIGLTSVRPASDTERTTLLVNGEHCAIESILAVDLTDESKMLPATGSSLLVVRDHYGADLLYDAADRAGILMIQCVPIDPQGQPEREVTAQVQRLASHPSLAGWYVGHLGRMSDPIAARLRDLDPTRAVFHDMPGAA